VSDVFKGKKVLITGASKGLGKAAALAFERKGAKLALAARSGEKLDALAASFSEPDKHLVFGIDLLEPVNLDQLAEDVLNQWGGVDVILHCVGGSLGINDSLPDWSNFAKSLKGNIGVAAEINRHFVPGMKEQNSGNIIHVGSVVGIQTGGSVPYSTAKAALSGYVRSLGRDLADHGIVVSGIVPGAFYGDDNAMFRYEFYKPDEYKEFVKSLPKQRMPHVDEYIPMLLLLANPASLIMSGSLVSMDGSQGYAYYNYSE